MKKFLAFTLAEVLVTLGIIGVVSALTVPTLMKNHQRKVFVTQLRKVYSQLSQAAEQAMTDNNAVSLSESEYAGASANNAMRFIQDSFKTVKHCTTAGDGCIPTSYKALDGTSHSSANYSNCYVIADGAAICLFSGSSWEKFVDSDSHDQVSYIIDVNSVAGPNVVGRDMFEVIVYDDGKVGGYYDSSYSPDKEDRLDYCKEGGFGYGGQCIDYLMLNGWEMDY